MTVAGQNSTRSNIVGSAPPVTPRTTAATAVHFQKGKKKEVLDVNYQNGRYSVLWNGTDLSAEIVSVIFSEFKPGVIPEVTLIARPEHMRMNLDTKYVNVRVPNGKTQQAQAPPPQSGQPACAGCDGVVRNNGSPCYGWTGCSPSP